MTIFEQLQKPIRLLGYLIDRIKDWVVASRFDLSAKEVALVYKLL